MIARGYWTSVAGMIVILLIASAFIVETLPPRTIMMATGAEGGANYELGVRYREILAQSGVDLQLLSNNRQSRKSDKVT